MIVPLLITLLGTGPSLDKPSGDVERLQGTWTVARMEIDGKPQPPGGPLFVVKVTFRVNEVLVAVGNRPADLRGTFKIDDSKSPKTYDLTTSDGLDIHGIYELEGEMLKLCLSGPGDARPTAMKTIPGDGRTLIVYQRESQGSGGS